MLGLKITWWVCGCLPCYSLYIFVHSSIYNENYTQLSVKLHISNQECEEVSLAQLPLGGMENVGG